ncbi:DUF4352 domain-containing protein [Streptomyces sp. NPDC007904]|jgi:hypothetical protein|uniref:DUF4352 domain-containing protein n=1 Tax=Streptomyces sp. NPDC007904 TaxID=3364787 RepID=UPI0036EB20CD
MSRQYPPQYPQQPNQPQQPGPGAPPPQQPKKRSVGRIAGLGCAGILALFVVIAVAAGGGDSEDSGDSKSSGTSAAAGDPRGDNGASGDKAEKRQKDASEEEQAQGPVKITAQKTAFAKSILAGSGDYTSVSVTVTNDGDEPVNVNPLYFAITDTDGTKHTAELGVDEKQIDTVDLAPGENISGTITGRGDFTPKYVTYTDGFLGDPIRANVS